MERDESTASSLKGGDTPATKDPERRSIASNIAAYLEEHEDHSAARVMQIHDS
jgi:hypothetical protein